MPCDSISTNRVKLAENTSPELLAKAMAALGVSPGQWYHDKAAQEVVLRVSRSNAAGEITQANIAQAYSAEVVKATAAKRGWKLKQVAPFKFVALKGGI
jgi:hypothetical protein